MNLVFLHTAQSNAELFSEAMHRENLPEATHLVREDLLRQAGDVGLGNPVVWHSVEEAMRVELQGCDGLICTCSTLGPVADHLHQQGLATTRSDAFLAKAFLSHAHQCDPQARCAVVIVAASTKVATQALFEAVQAHLGANGLQVDVMLIEGPWDLFLKGDHQAYLQTLADALETLVDGNQYYQHFALAQASMAQCLDRKSVV